MSVARRPGAGGRGRARPRLHERHDQDAGRRDPAPEAAVPRPGAVGARRQASAAGLVAGAARLRRIVPLAAHVAAVEVPGRRHQDPDRHQRAAARRQDDDGGQHRDGAGLRRRARAAHRRRHAPARPAPAAAPDQRARPVAGAHRPGARARRHPAHGRSEPAGDHRRPNAAEPVGAAGVGAHEDAARRTWRTGRSTGSSSIRRRCSPSPTP